MYSYPFSNTRVACTLYNSTATHIWIRCWSAFWFNFSIQASWGIPRLDLLNFDKQKFSKLIRLWGQVFVHTEFRTKLIQLVLHSGEVLPKLPVIKWVLMSASTHYDVEKSLVLSQILWLKGFCRRLLMQLNKGITPLSFFVVFLFSRSLQLHKTLKDAAHAQIRSFKS